MALSLLATACSGPAPETPETPEPQHTSPPDVLRDLVSTLGDHAAAAPLLAVEQAVAEVEHTLLNPLAAALVGQDAETAARLLASCIEQPAWATAERTVVSTVDGITESTWAPTTVRMSELSPYLAAFGVVDHADLFVVGAVPAGDGLALAVRFNLRGRTALGRRHDRGTLTVFAGPVGDVWMASRVRVTELRTLSSTREPHLHHAGALTWPSAAPRGHGDLASGPPLVLADLDADGRLEAVTASPRGPAIVRLGDDGPEQRATPTLESTGEVTALAVATGADGSRQLVACGPEVEAPSRCVLIADPLTGARLITPLPGVGRPGVPGAAVAADFTGDGRDDLWVGYRPDRALAAEPAPLSPPPTQALWTQDDQGTWTSVPDPFPPSADDDRAPPLATFGLAAVLGDSGRTLLLVADGAGRGSRAFGWTGDHFEELTGPLGLDVRGWATGIAAGDADGDGLIDLYVARLELVASRRMAWTWRDRSAPPATSRVLRDLTRRFRRSLLLRHLPGDTFTDVGQRAGVDWAGAGAGVPVWLDHDADGDLDLYVPNGLWTGGSEDADALFALALATADSHVDAPPAPTPHLLASFQGTVAKPFTDLGVPTLSLGGHQRAVLFRNDGGQFTEVGYLEGVDDMADAWAAVAGDVDGDGRDDLVVRARLPTRAGEPAPALRVWHGGP